MAGFTISATNHTSFTVSSLDRAIGLFRDALGFTLLIARARSRVHRAGGGRGRRGYRGRLPAGAGHRLELIEYRGPADRGRVESRPCDAPI